MTKARKIPARLLALFLALALPLPLLAAQAGAINYVVSIDYMAETISVKTGTQWTEDPDEGYITTALWDEELDIGEEGHASYRLYFGNTLYFRADENSQWQEITIPERKPVPSGVLGGVGQILNVDNRMEYSGADGVWHDCTGSTVTGLAAGYYRVRYAANPSAFAGEILTVRVTGAGRTFADVASGTYYSQPVQWAVQNGVTTGTSATTFSPAQSCTWAQVITFLWRAEGIPLPYYEGSAFLDVTEDSYYCTAASWASEAEISQGIDELNFGPDNTITRKEAVTFLWRAAGSPAADGDSGFADVPADAYYAQAVQWAVEEGITNGNTATTFGPDIPCTRADVVTFLYRAYAE